MNTRPTGARESDKGELSMHHREIGTRRSGHLVLAVLLAATVLLLASCLPGDGKNSAVKPANFLMGIWHGWVAPISIIAGLFNKAIRVYEVNNTGWWYDFGFYMAIISGFGGLTLSRKGKKKE